MMIISFTEAAKASPKIPATPDLGTAPKSGDEVAKDLEQPPIVSKEIPEPSAEDDITDDSFDDDIGGFDPNNPAGIPTPVTIPITVATEYISQLKDIKISLDRLSSISFNLSIDLNKESLSRKNFIEEQIAEVNSLYDITAAGCKELIEKLPELIKMFNDIINNIYQELKKLNLEYGVVKTKLKNQKTDLKKSKKDK